MKNKVLSGIHLQKLFLPLLLIFSMYSSAVHAQSATQVNVTGTSSAITISNNTATAVDPGLTVMANGNITGFIVSITGSYTSGDVLSYSGSLPSGITAAAFNTNTRSLVFSGTTSAANWQTLLRTVTLQTTSATCYPESRKVAFTAGNKYYNPLTGHFYEYYTTGLYWLNAKSNAASQSYFGREGYLATITSVAENNFIWKVMNADCWIGGSDDYTAINSAAGSTIYASQTASEGKFYWVTGPEKGTQFSNQNAYETGGVQTVSGRYHNWYSGEPNDWPNQNSSVVGEENYVQFYSNNNGTWNDLSNTDRYLSSLIEYGGMPDDDTTSVVVFTRDINVNGAPSGTISGGSVSVCSGSNSTTLTVGGLTGSVVRWESSPDNFFTAGTAISNTSTSYTVSNITQTTYYRAVVNTTSPATCTNLVTSSVPVYVTATEAGNVFAENNTICPGSSAELTLFGNSGSVLKWQLATNNSFTSPTDISNTTTHLNYALGSTGTYYFRAQVQNNGCGSPVFTTGCTITVTTGTPPVGGSVSSAEHCSGSNSGTLTLSGYTSSVQKWQYSADNGIIWTDVANTTVSLSYSGVTSTRLYRAVVSNGSCGTTYSSEGTVLVYGNTQYQWLGTTSASASATSNWKCGTIPPAGADVVISSAAVNDMTLGQDYIFGNIDFSASGRKIILGNYNLTATGFTGAGSSNYVQTSGTGKLIMVTGNGSSKTFPVGNSAWNPVTITNNSGNSDNFSVRVLDEVYANGSNGTALSSPRVKRTWDIAKANANGGSGVNFAFNWNSGEAVSITTPALYHYEGGNWIKQTGSTSSTSTSLAYTGYTGTFSPFAVGDNGTTLPVTWLSFIAQKQNDYSVLKWETTYEANTKDFTVQHSGNGIDWTNVGIIPASGNSTIQQSYSFVHTSPVRGMNYYRLVQQDIDRRITYSKVAVLLIPGRKDMAIYPNPVSNGHVIVELEEKTTLRIYNSIGELVLQKQLPAGKTILNLSILANGIYRVQVNGKAATILIQ